MLSTIRIILMGSAAAVGIALAAPASAQQVCDMIPDPDGSVAGTNSVSCGALVNGDFAAGFGVGANVASGGHERRLERLDQGRFATPVRTKDFAVPLQCS